MNIADLNNFASLLDHPLRLVAIPQNKKENPSLALQYVVDICARKIGALEKLNLTHNLYYHINPDKDPMHKGKSKDGDIDRICFLGLDYDSKPKVTLNQLEILPTCTVLTSPSKGKFQHLIALNHTTFDIAKYRIMARRFSKITGSDPSCIDIARIFRLPGSVNLKVNEVSWLAESNADAPIYSYDDLNELLDNYEQKLAEVIRESGVPFVSSHNDELDIYADIPIPTNKKKTRTKDYADDNEPEIIDVKLGDISIREAIKLAKAKKKIKCEGNRHNNRVSWTSSMAQNVVRGKVTKEKAISVVHKLISLFDPPFDAHDLEQERRMVVKDMATFIDKDMKVASSIYNDVPLKKTLVSDDDSDSSIDGGKDSSENTSASLSLVPSGKELAYMTKDGFSLVNLTMVKKVIGNVDVVSLFKAYALFRSNDGSTKEVLAIISKAILDSGIQIDNRIVFEKGITNSWGFRSHHLYIPGDMDVIREWVSSLIGHTKDLLSKPEIIEQIKETKDYKEVCDYIKECLSVEMVNPKTGLLDHKALGVELKKNIVRIFRHPFKNQKEKDILVKALCNKIETEHLGSANEGKELEAVFQNGKWIQGKGWIKCEAWRESVSSSPCRIDTTIQSDIRRKVLKKLGDKLRLEDSKGEVTGYVQRYSIGHKSLANVLKYWCPEFASLLDHAFSDDYESWTKVLLMLGYTLTSTNPLRKIFFLYGESTSGKNLLAKVFMGIVGKVNGVVIQYDNIVGEYEGLDKAINKQFCIVDEPSPKNEKLIHARVGTKLKRATSGEVLQVRGIRQSSVEHQFETKFMVVSNDPPQFVDSAGSFKARIVPLFFGNAYIGVQDPLLSNKILSKADRLATVALSVLSYSMKIQELDNKAGFNKDLFDFGNSVTDKISSKIENKVQDTLSGVDPIIKSAVNECLVKRNRDSSISQDGLLRRLVVKYSNPLDIEQLRLSLGDDELEAQIVRYIRATLGASGRVHEGKIKLRGVSWK
jgi:hypothetical protein